MLLPSWWPQPKGELSLRGPGMTPASFGIGLQSWVDLKPADNGCQERWGGLVMTLAPDDFGAD